VFQRCACRDPQTKKFLHGKCPQLGKKGHGAWWFRYDAPGPDGKRRQPMVGPFPIKKAAEEELAATLARISGGSYAPDRSLTVSAYLTAYVEGKIDVKPSTQAASREAVDLYWKPALGHLRLVDLRDHHIAEAIREMGKINRHQLEDERPSEMLRRMMGARAESVKKHLAPGEQRRKKSTKPLSPARIKRVVAVLNAALNAAVPRKIALNPCEGVILPRVKKVRPLLWTAEREAAFRAALQRKTAAAETDRKLTTGAIVKTCGSRSFMLLRAGPGRRVVRRACR
jgi:hypothetical protein